MQKQLEMRENRQKEKQINNNIMLKSFGKGHAEFELKSYSCWK